MMRECILGWVYLSGVLVYIRPGIALMIYAYMSRRGTSGTSSRETSRSSRLRSLSLLAWDELIDGFIRRCRISQSGSI